MKIKDFKSHVYKKSSPKKISLDWYINHIQKAKEKYGNFKLIQININYSNDLFIEFHETIVREETEREKTNREMTEFIKSSKGRKLKIIDIETGTHIYDTSSCFNFPKLYKKIKKQGKL